MQLPHLQVRSKSVASATASALLTASQIASSYNLPHLWSSTMPTTSIAASTTSQPPALAYLKSNYNLYKYQLYSPNASALSFPTNPITAGATDTVLGVEYPTGSWSANSLGGLQFYSQPFPNTTTASTGIQTAVMTYQMALSPNWNFVKGGKLPGLFGGPVGHCSGGDHSLSCFSARMMWRPKGAGEVYAYIPIYDGFCSATDVICDSDYGTSLSRGSFTFSVGSWTNITMLVSLNVPPLNNGLLSLWVNGTLAMTHSNIAWRVDPSITLSKMFFSTFFGGSDSSWESPVDAHSYFRGFEIYGSTLASNTTGVSVNASVTPNITSSATSAYGYVGRKMPLVALVGIVVVGLLVFV